MARESSLWGRIRDTAIPAMIALGYRVDLQRLENAVAVGHPDVEGCIDGAQVWIELKSEARPKRASTPVRFKLRPSQSIWHNTRTIVGSRIHWVLAQVGEGHHAALYLIPGSRYDDLRDKTESEIAELSVCVSNASLCDVILRAVRGW